jgi:hypothetical protein
VQHRHRAGQVGEKDEARLERADEERLAALVVTRDLGSELADARRDGVGREVDLADARV